ncbi:hemerythrin domain-containing protein [Nocardia sp. NPDC006630]|uniref:hemerythrin domain-containing protein n=1 Tax=Nocardia sp. NPDC006630 TaxID=3157181 RepID=UPI0033B97B4B
MNCDFYCDVLTAHHSLEDHRMFPVMQRTFPELAPVIERLHAEHEAVATLITETKSAALSLSAEHASVDRARAAITALAGHLMAHLDFEEQSLFPKMHTDWHYG